MSEYNSNYNQLIEKLDQFIRKYYVNKLIKGSLITIGIILAIFLIFSLLEYYFYFSTGIRKLLFYSFIGTTVTGFGFWVIDPLTRYFKLGTTISHEDAAMIIGEHFIDVKDKLLNILQLKKQESHESNDALIEASIEQKTNSISLVPFKSAIDYSNNRKYLRYALPPFLLLIFILFAAPSIIKDSTSRIINNNRQYIKAAPFSYMIEDSDLKVVQYQDYNLNVNVEGAVMPENVFVTIDDFQYKMEKAGPSEFSYIFRNVQKDIDFKLQSGTVSSVPYKLEVLEKPNLTDFSVELAYPSYLNRNSELLQNSGDMALPEGTKLTWIFDANNTDDISMLFGDGEVAHKAERRDETKFRYTKKAMSDENYKVFLSNRFVPQPDSLVYNISVIKDQYPTITSEKIIDSLDRTLVYFIGNASDDYGLNSLSFNYIRTKEDGSQQPLQKQKISKQDGRDIQFDYIFDIKKLNLLPGEKLSFYFEVFDNDGVNGSKSSKTSIMTYEKPTLDEIKMLDEQNDEAIKDKLKDALKDMDKLNENIKKLREKLLQDKQLKWQDKKEMEKILDEQKKLLEKLEKAKEKLDENIKNQEEFKTQPEEVQQKQEKLQELFEKALDPETKELMDKIKDLLQELEKEDAVQMLEQFEMNNQTKEKEMKRMLELYKQLEMEKQVKDQIKALEKLADQQEKLADQTEKKEKSAEELKKEQEELNKAMEEMKKKQEELEKKNKELSPPKDMGKENKEKMEDAKKDMEQSKDQLEKKDNAGASKSQKKAAQKMKKQAKEMETAMEGGASDQAGEDIKTIRQLLENLVTVSFDQEGLFSEIGAYMVTTPAYPAAIRKQFKLENDFKIIEDTLVALSNRNTDIEAYVMDKVAEIKYNLKESIQELEDRMVPESQEKQRRTMKNLNDLALMMNESLDKAQQSSGAPGSGSCDKPGGKGSKGKSGKIPMDKITEGQQGLSEEMKEMKEKMDKAKKEGKEGKGGKEGMSAKDFAQAAARQAALRKALEELQNDKKEQGKGSKELDEIINNMDNIETELVNKRLNSETLKRMQDIETRLLEAEKAERQRELDNKRKSETAMEKRKEMPPALQDYLKKRQAEIDMYKTVSPSLKPYYKTLVDEYYKSLKSVK
ncbi:MAG: DUF4175 domain-containing protein [Saprospiraceae bacterium]|jgi:hypothetical protein|nr:DUF4175 domain-containing protein [Saprospiraceae bacterium]MBL0027200.1 DUF4175 domain-containing protein [Saprospiraceae bacterium]